MKKLLKIAILSIMALGLSTSVVNADASKGQKLFIKKLKKDCGFNGGVMAKKFSQDEWKSVNDAGKLADKIKEICPKASSKALKKKYVQHYFDFFYEYANDSGNVPAC